MNEDFEDEVTAVIEKETMAELMEQLRGTDIRSPGVPTQTSSRQTKPICPNAIRKAAEIAAIESADS